MNKEQKDTFLTDQELADRWKNKVSLKTLKYWRQQGEGPPHMLVAKSPLYPLSQLVEWENKNIKHGDVNVITE